MISNRGGIMPTDSNKSILYRELAIVNNKKMIDICSPMLKEMVNYSIDALLRCMSSGTVTQNEDENNAVFTLYRNMIEFTDGIEVLISNSCQEPAIIILRSIFESYMGLLYILQDKTHYAQRSLSWLIFDIHKRIDEYNRLDPTTTKGKEFKAGLEKERIAGNNSISIIPKEKLDSARKNLLDLIAKPHLINVEEEYSHRKNQNWFSLFEGPVNRLKLAEDLHLSGQYDLLYRYWSKIAHGEDFNSFTKVTQNGQSGVKPLRDSKEMDQITIFTVIYLMDATRELLKKFREGESILKWYIREIQKPFKLIAGIKEETKTINKTIQIPLINSILIFDKKGLPIPRQESGHNRYRKFGV
jgi:hypothetical protein